MAGEFYGIDDNPREVELLIAELIAVYAAASKELHEQLIEATTSFQRFRYHEQIRQVDAITKALEKELQDILDKGMIDDAYKHGTDIAQKAMRRQGISVKPPNLGNQINTQAVQSVTEQVVSDLTKANNSMRESARTILRKTQQDLLEEGRINRMIQDGILKGQARRDVSAKLAKEFRDVLGDRKFIQAGARRFTPEYYAELVVRTQTREAVTEGTIRTALEYKIDLVRVSVHENACPICTQFQGRVYSISGRTPGYPQLDRRPPYHPNCKHVITPHIPTDDKKEKRLRELSNDTKPVTGIDQYRETMSGSKGGPVHSENAIDRRIRQLLDGDKLDPRDRGLVTTRVRQAKFDPGDTLDQRKAQGLFSDAMNGKSYKRVIVDIALDKQAKVALHTGKAGPMVTMLSKTSKVIKPELRGPTPGQFTAVTYSANTGQVLSVTQVDAIESLTLGSTPQWLQ